MTDGMRRRTALPALLLGLAGLVALPSSAPARSTAEPPSAPPASVLADARRIVEFGMPDRVVRQMLGAQQGEVIRDTYASANRAGDLDGDGIDDVFALRVDYELRIDWGSALEAPSVEEKARSVVSALDGRTGERMWRRSFDDFVLVVRARLGKGGRPGALLVSGLQSFIGPIEDRYLNIDARSGRTGERLWRSSFRTLSNETAQTAVYKDAPLSIGLFDGIRGEATDVIVGVGDVVGAAYTWVTTSRAVVVDGSNGKQRVHPQPSVGINWFPTPDPVGDLDGDGLDDYVITHDRWASTGGGQQPPSLSGMVLARRGVDGAEIWNEEGFEFFWLAWSYDLGDVTGDGKIDIGIMTGKVDEDALFVAGLCVCKLRFGTYLVDGRGRKRWLRNDGWPSSPGDIDGDGARDVVTRDVSWSFRKGVVTHRHSAYTAAGKRLWRRNIQTRYEPGTCKAACAAGMAFGTGQIGDTGNDSVEETFSTVSVEQQPGEDVEVHYLADGRTGLRTLRAGPEMLALGASMDGRGTDIVDVDIQATRIELRGRDGRDASLLWRSGFETPTVRRLYGDVQHARLDRDRCVDALVVANAGDTIIVAAIDGGSGRILWWQRMKGTLDARPFHSSDNNRAC